MKHKLLILILLLTASTRLFHIAFPIAGWHSWRQSDTAAIARNFSTEEYNILYPRIDWRGSTNGRIETEFQLYTFTIATAYKLFGVHEVFGRMLSLIFAIGTVIGIYLLVGRMLDETTAAWSSFFYAILPLNIYYGRAFMPEQLMLLCSVWGILLFDRWLESPEKKSLYAASLIAVTLAVLVKLPTLYIGLPLLYLAWNKFGLNVLRQPRILLFAAVVLLLTGAWYYHSHQLKLETGLTFGIWEAGSDKWGNVELLTSLKFYNDVFFKNIAERHFTYAAFIPFVAGLFLKRTKEKEWLFDFWMVAVIIYILIVARGNQVHEYYQLPFMLPGVVFLGKTFAEFLPLQKPPTRRRTVLRSVLLVLCAGTLVLSFLRMQNLLSGERIESAMFKIAETVKKETSPENLIITVSEGNPVVLYNCDRKGWSVTTGSINEAFLAAKKSEGARYLVSEKEVFLRNGHESIMNELLKTYVPIADSEEYFIITL